jgi:hypothetical protein
MQVEQASNTYILALLQQFMFVMMCNVVIKLKLCNDQRNAQVFNLFIYLHLPYMFRAFF